jgi:heat shock protein HslJ
MAGRAMAGGSRPTNNRMTDSATSEERGSLDGSSWTLVEGEGITTPDNVSLTIAFEAGRVSGSGGCNRFTGSYQEEGARISLGTLASTRRACAEEIMRTESAYFSALESASSWSATSDELVLADVSGRALLRYVSRATR